MEEEPQDQDERPKAPSPRVTAALAAFGLAVLLSPLLLLLHKRKAVIPEAEEGIAPITQFSGREDAAPHVKLEPPVKRAPPPAPVPRPEPAIAAKLVVKPQAKPAEKPREKSVELAATVSLPSWADETAKAPPPMKAAAPEPVVPTKAAPPAKKAAKKARRRVVVKAAPAPPVEKDSAEDVWARPATPVKPAAPETKPAPKPQVAAAPAAPAPAKPSSVHGRRAEQPAEILPSAPQAAPAEGPEPPASGIVIGQIQDRPEQPPSKPARKSAEEPGIIVEHVDKNAP